MPGIDECLREAMVLPGARGAAVVDWTSGLALGTVGASPVGDHEATAAETAELARMAAEQPSFAAEAAPAPGSEVAVRGLGRLPGTAGEGRPGPAPAAGVGTGVGSGVRTATVPVAAHGVAPEAPGVEDVIVSTRSGYHLLRFVETGIDSTVFLHLWLDRDEGNLALARLRLQDLARRLVLE